jgi:hypothetical protein
MVLIHADHITQRLEYVADFIFKNLFNTGYELISGRQDTGAGKVVIHYTATESASGIWIKPMGLLELRPPNEDDQSAGLSLCRDILEAVDQRDLKNLDIFSFVFFCISRYEEYQPFNSDHFGRFQAKSSVAHRLGFLDRSLVEEVLSLFEKTVQTQYPVTVLRLLSNYHFISTIDIDQAWSYKHKGFRNVLGLGRELLKADFRHIGRRIRVLTGLEKDPFDTYDIIQKIHQEADVAPRFFILLASRKNKLDKNHTPKNKPFQQLIREISRTYETGIHPSYRSNKKQEIVAEEKATLEKIISKVVTSSRQHFLMLSLPNTYRKLVASGITDDFSMGYADKPGYRASTGHSFPWYDVYREEATPLRIHPFQVMDVTLKNYNKFGPAHATAICRKIIEKARTYGSPFCLIWHNSSLDEKGRWAGWTGTYASIVQIASNKKALQSKD